MTESLITRVARAVGKPLANMTGGCFKPDNGRSERGDCADGDCYCARVTRHCATAAIEAMRHITPAMQAVFDQHAGTIAIEFAWDEAITAALGEQP